MSYLNNELLHNHKNDMVSLRTKENISKQMSSYWKHKRDKHEAMDKCLLSYSKLQLHTDCATLIVPH